MKHTHTSSSHSEKKKQLIDPKLYLHIFFVALIVVAAVWVYNGVEEKPFTTTFTPKQVEETVGMKMMNHATTTAQKTATADTSSPSPLAVKSSDDAVRSYLKAAQVLAEVYRFNNHGSYAGLCEQSSDLYTLEGNSGGILKFIKLVGATEVFCYTGQEDYMIEAKMPENGMFYCIDQKGVPVEQQGTKEGVNSCS